MSDTTVHTVVARRVNGEMVVTFTCTANPDAYCHVYVDHSPDMCDSPVIDTDEPDPNPDDPAEICECEPTPQGECWVKGWFQDAPYVGEDVSERTDLPTIERTGPITATYHPADEYMDWNWAAPVAPEGGEQ